MACVIKRITATKGTTFFLKLQINGKTVKERYGSTSEGVTEKMAKTALAVRVSEIARGEIERKFDITIKKGASSTEEVLAPYMEYSRNSCRGHVNHVLAEKYFTAFFKTPSEFCFSGYEAYKAKRLSEGIAHSTIDRELAFLSAALRFAVKHKKLPRNFEDFPKLIGKHNVKNNYFSLEEIELILDACVPYSRMHSFCVISFFQGFRKSEALSVRWSEIDFANRLITLAKTKTEAYSKTTFFLHEDVFEYLVALKQKNAEEKTALVSERNRLTTELPTAILKAKMRKRIGVIANRIKDLESDFVIVYRGKQMIEVDASWCRLLKAAEVPYSCPHTTRHTYATQQLMAGCNMMELLETGLWKNIKSLMRYVHIEKAALAKKLNNFSLRKPEAKPVEEEEKTGFTERRNYP